MSSNSDTPHFKFYHYDPSLAGACVFAVLFGLSTLWHLILIIKHRTWYFIPVVVGGICVFSLFFPTRPKLTCFAAVEVTGYAARGVSNQQAPHPTLAPYVIQTLLLLVAPALFAASIYMILGRIIISTDAESLSMIKKRWLTKIFVTSDVISFFVQLGGKSHYPLMFRGIKPNICRRRTHG
jgi:hypothetical protein